MTTSKSKTRSTPATQPPTPEQKQTTALTYFRERLAEDRAVAVAAIRDSTTRVASVDEARLVNEVERLQEAIDAARRLAVIESLERGGSESLEDVLEELKTQLLRMPTNPYRSSRGTANLLEIAKGEALRDLYGTVRSLLPR